MFSREASVVGLDIGNHSIKVTQLKKGKKGLELVHFGVVTFPIETISDGIIENFSIISDAINELFRQEKIKTKNIISAVSATKSVVIKKLSLPLMTEEDLTKSIETEAEQYIPFDINEVNMDFYIIKGEELKLLEKKKRGKKNVSEDEDVEQMDIILVAAKKELVEERYKIIQEAGLKTVVMDLDVFALENAYEFNYGVEERSSIALVDIGSLSTTINIIEEGITAFTKDVSMGGIKYTQAIQRELNLNFEQAENLKMGVPVAGVDPKSVVPIIISLTKNIAQGIQKVFEVYTLSAHKKIKKVMLSGGGVNIEGIDKILADCLNVPVEFINPFKNLIVNSKLYDHDYLEKVGPMAAISVGLALRRMDDK